MKLRNELALGEKTVQRSIGVALQRKLLLAVSIRHRIVCNLIGTKQSQRSHEKNLNLKKLIAHPGRDYVE